MLSLKYKTVTAQNINDFLYFQYNLSQGLIAKRVLTVCLKHYQLILTCLSPSAPHSVSNAGLVILHDSSNSSPSLLIHFPIK